MATPDSPKPAYQPRHNRGDRWLRWLSACLAGFALLVLGAILRGTPEDVAWYAQHLLPWMAVVAFSGSRIGRPFSVSALTAYSVALPLLTVLVGVGLVNPWDDGVRLQLFTQNPNVLGADLVAVTLAAMLVGPRATWLVWLPVIAVATAFTGSRTALLALTAGLAIWLLLPTTTWRARLLGLVAMGAASAAITFGVWQVASESASPNLLQMTATFDDPRWRTFGDADVVVQRGSVPGPLPRTRGDRVTAATHGHTLAIYQGAGRSLEGESYVASVYLRADEEQALVLSSHLSGAVCVATREWTRCETPPGLGDGRLSVQLRLETVEDHGSFEIEAFGPQVVIGDDAQPYLARGASLLPPGLVGRLTPNLSDLVPAAVRGDVWAVALDAFAAAPWIGVGQASAAHLLRERPASPAAHAHNALLQTLVTDGVLGVVALALVVVSSAGLASWVVCHKAVPWASALVILNTLDLTALHAGTYFSTGIVIGALAAERAPWD